MRQGRRPRRDHPPGTGPGRPGPRPGRRVLARTDGAGGTKKTIEPLTRRRASCSVGVHPARPHTADPRAPSPRPPRAPAYHTDGHPGNGAHAAETRRPAGPNRMAPGHAGQPRATSSPTRAPGRASRTSQKLPATALATNTKGGRLPGLEARHRPRTRRQGTASAAQKTPGSTTSLRRASRRTVSGARSWPRPADLPTFSQTSALADASAHAWEPTRFLHVGGDRTGGLRPRLGTQDDPPATDEHPRRHYPPRPPHRPPPQDRPPPEHLTARRPPAPPDPTGPIDTRPLHLAHHDPERRTPAPKKTRPPRGDTRQTTTPTRHNPTHNNGNDTTQPHSTNQQKPRPDARVPSSLKKKKRKRPPPQVLESVDLQVTTSTSHRTERRIVCDTEIA